MFNYILTKSDLLNSGAVSIHEHVEIEKLDREKKDEIMNAKPKVFIPFATKKMIDSVSEDSDDDAEEHSSKNSILNLQIPVLTPKKPYDDASGCTNGPSKIPFQSPIRKLSTSRPKSAPDSMFSAIPPQASSGLDNNEVIPCITDIKPGDMKDNDQPRSDGRRVSAISLATRRTSQYAPLVERQG